MTPKTYEWHLRFRNDHMGYGKSKTVVATTIEVAQIAARALIAADGYDPADFALVEAKRGTLV